MPCKRYFGYIGDISKFQDVAMHLGSPSAEIEDMDSVGTQQIQSGSIPPIKRTSLVCINILAFLLHPLGASTDVALDQ